jgi:CheY-like chemotaxis protein
MAREATHADATRTLLAHALPDRWPMKTSENADRTLTVLVADDHFDTRLILRHYLEAMGHRVFEAADGAEALRVVRAEKPDAVVLDIQMPVMDGIQVMRVIRADPELASLPVLALSAHALSEEVREITAAGADRYLAKPAHPRDVHTLLRALVRGG